MKQIILMTFLVVGFLTISHSQNIIFNQVHPPSPFPPMFADFAPLSSGATTFLDVDGDSDQDLIITGSYGGGPLTRLYINDGVGNFYEVQGAAFVSICRSSVAYADIDADNDEDLLFTGNTSTLFDQPTSKLYTNDGTGNFTEVNGTPFENVQFGSTAFVDVDGDGDFDVFITGKTISNQLISKLYTNNGFGNFTEVLGTPFEPVQFSSIAFADIDGDNDQDIVQIGKNDLNESVTNLYKNDGLGNYALVPGTPFIDVSSGSIDFGDVDGDADLDLLIMGSNNSGQPVTKLYLNDSVGNFTDAIGSSFYPVHSGSVTFIDIDNDNDEDILICGTNNFNEKRSTLYTNNGFGAFTELIGSALDPSASGTISIADVDSDSATDIILTGVDANGVLISKLYHNNGFGNFAEATGTPFEMVMKSSVAFADVDGDSDQDVVITGTNFPNIYSKLYLNNGAGDYAEVTGTPFSAVQDGDIAFADVDNDNDSDLLITGLSSTGIYVTELYMNDGNGSFTQNTSTSFIGVKESTVSFSDVDGDLDADFIVTGRSNGGAVIIRMYLNDGGGSYTEASGIPFQGVTDGAIAFSDIDGDNDNDVLIAGYNTSANITARLYTNDGNGNFTYVPLTPFAPIRSCSIAFSDLDGDNDEDLVISGEGVSNIPITKVYVNNGTGTFSEVTGTPFEGVTLGDLIVFDVDKDQDQDILLCGSSENYPHVITKLYTNDGTGNFTEIVGLPLDGVMLSSIAVADIDGDNYQDVLITGRNQYNKPISKLYRNDSYCITESILNSTFQNGGDLTTNANGFSYQWVNCSDGNPIFGENSQSFTPQTNGNYAVVISNGTCSDTSNCVTVNNAGISSNQPEDRFTIFPNPTSEVVNIQFGKKLPWVQISVVTVEGKLISQKIYENQEEVVILLNNKSGVYLVNIHTSDFNEAARVVKL